MPKARSLLPSCDRSVQMSLAKTSSLWNRDLHLDGVCPYEMGEPRHRRQARQTWTLPGMSDSGVRSGQEVGSVVLNSCSRGGPESRPTHTRASHSQNQSRLSHAVCKFTGPSILTDTIRKLLPTGDPKTKICRWEPLLQSSRNTRGQRCHAPPHPREPA